MTIDMQVEEQQRLRCGASLSVLSCMVDQEEAWPGTHRTNNAIKQGQAGRVR